MLEGNLISDLPENTIDQVLQMLAFPAIQSSVVDFHQPFQVGCRDNELIGLQKSEDFLVIPA
jgi:hypothetical protein